VISGCEEYVITLLPELIHDLTKQRNMRRIAEVDPDAHVSPLRTPPTAGAWSPEPYGKQTPLQNKGFYRPGITGVCSVRASPTGSR
jgi:hypothetical protein